MIDSGVSPENQKNADKSSTGTHKNREERRGICGICPAGCWVIADIDENGRLAGVQADEEHTPGSICMLGKHSPQIVYSEDRLKYPMRRVGPKGTYDFERISWDEAMATIAEKLQETKAAYGPEAAGIYTGRGSFDLALCDLFQPKETAVSSASSVLFPFGSPNTFGVGALCYVSYAMIAPHVTMGAMLIDMESEIDEAELIVVWGANPATDSPPLVHRQILDAKRRGADVVVIDPRRNGTARESGAEWVPIRPGTDGALALSMIQVLIEEDLYHEKFVKEWTVGFDELARYVQHFRPQAVEEITGVPAETIRDLARRIARARGASPVMYTGLEYSDSGVQAIRATMILWALAGQLDVPGGRIFRMRENAFPINKEDLISNPDVRKAIGRDRFPIYSLYRGESHAIALPEAVLEGRPYPIKSLIVLGGSIITAWPQPEIWRRTLGSLDFLVTIDRQLTADAAYADIVLPATTGYENTSYMTYGSLFRIRERLIEPIGEARNDLLILGEIAKRLGYGELYPQSEEEMLERVLEGSGFTPNEVRALGGMVRVPAAMMQYKKWEKGLLRSDGRPGFDTPSGKFEIASSILAEHGYDPLPVYTEPAEGPLASPETARDFPLVFNSGSRVKTDFRSQHHGVRELARYAPEPEVLMNKADAAERGIGDGDSVVVSTPHGSARFRAKVSENIVRGAVDANMGGGGPIGPEAWRSCNVNDLTDLNRYDPVSGFPIYKALLCEVEPVDQRVSHLLPDELSLQDSELIEDEIAVLEEAEEATKVVDRAIYLDHNATTPVDPAVLAAMLPFLEGEYGNPSSIHAAGRRARVALEAARRIIAQAINSTAKRIIFTGGGSEADNLAIKGVAFAYREKGRHIITSSFEHSAILAACRSLEKQGFSVTYLPVNKDGLVEAEALADTLRDDTILVSIMLANNEIGTIQPIAELAAMTKERGAIFHTDAVQALGKIPIDVEELGVDLLSVSGHKIHAPKGVGALFVRAGTEIVPLVDGGQQEEGLRAGTENLASIVGFAKATELAVRNLPRMQEVAALRDELQNGIERLVKDASVNGDLAKRLPNTLNMTLPGLRGESLVLRLDRHGIALSSGSACKSGSPDPSHALLALGLGTEEAHCSVRFSLGLENTSEEIARTLNVLSEVLDEASNSLRFIPCR